MDKFLVYKLTEKLDEHFLIQGSYLDFANAHDISLFMWGRDIGEYVIYKNRYLAKYCHLYGDIISLQKYLEGDIKYPDMKEK